MGESGSPSLRFDTVSFTTIIQFYSSVHFIFIQDGNLFASVLVFLDCDQLRQVGEEMDNVPSCVGEHCFAFCMQDIRIFAKQDLCEGQQ